MRRCSTSWTAAREVRPSCVPSRSVHPARALWCSSAAAWCSLSHLSFALALSAGFLDRTQIIEALRVLDVDATADATIIDRLLHSIDARDEECFSFADMKQIMRRFTSVRDHRGRFSVVISLAEAETLRALIHKRKVNGHDGDGAGHFALRIMGASDVCVDQSPGWTPSSEYDQTTVDQALRFFNGDMYFVEVRSSCLLFAPYSFCLLISSVLFAPILSFALPSAR